jgi:hypothetical protein
MRGGGPKDDPAWKYLFTLCGALFIVLLIMSML